MDVLDKHLWKLGHIKGSCLFNSEAYLRAILSRASSCRWKQIWISKFGACFLAPDWKNLFAFPHLLLLNSFLLTNFDLISLSLWTVLSQMSSASYSTIDLIWSKLVTACNGRKTWCWCGWEQCPDVPAVTAVLGGETSGLRSIQSCTFHENISENPPEIRERRGSMCRGIMIPKYFLQSS